MNRVTWRNILCMGDAGPSTDPDTKVEAPLDSSQMGNVVSTIEGMSSRDRLAFMASFIRFMLELAHQVSVAMITEGPHADNHMSVDEEEFNLMQRTLDTNTLVDKARATFGNLQKELETDTRHRHQRAQQLIRQLRDRWGVNLPKSGSDEIQNLLAMLIVYMDESYDDREEKPDVGDDEWATRWSQRLHGYIEGLLEMVETAVALPNHPPSTPLDLDTQTSFGSGLDSATTATASSSCPTALHAGGVPLVTPSSALARLEQEAAALQSQEDRALEQEMQRHQGKRARAQVNISVSSGASTSRARLHIPSPPPGVPLQVQTQLQLHDEGEDADDTDLMQRSTRPTRPLINALQPGAQRRVLRRLHENLLNRVGLLLREVHAVLREYGDVVAMQEERPADCVPGTPTTEWGSDDALAEQLAHVYLQDLQDRVDNLLLMELDVDIGDLLTQLLNMYTCLNLPEEQERRARLQPSVGRGTEGQILNYVNQVEDETRHFLLGRDPSLRDDIRRDFVITLIGGMQNVAAQLFALLHLVGHHLPQPFAIADASSTPRTMGRSYGRDVLHYLAQAFGEDLTEGLGNTHFGVTEILPFIPAVGAATQAMIFLEDGQYALDNMSSPDQEDSPNDAINQEIREAIRQSRIAGGCLPDDDGDGHHSEQLGGATGSTPPGIEPFPLLPRLG